MKRFFISILCATVFFIGLGTMIEKTAATFKSDDKAMELIRQARQAIGGDSAINSVKSMTILGKTTKTFEVEGTARTEQGDLEINFELPSKLSKTLKIGADNGDGKRIIDKKVEVIVMKKGDGTEEVVTEDVKPIIIRKSADFTSSTSGDGKKIIINKNGKGGGEHFRSNELFRTTLSLLLTAPDGLDVSYIYVGEGNVDGYTVEIVEARSVGSSIKLYLDKTSNLPRMVSFQSHKPAIFKVATEDVKPDANGGIKVITRQTAESEMAEFQIKFSDFRNVNGIQLPFKWSQTVGGQADELTDITNYEINPTNIAEKFNKSQHKVKIRTEKP